MNELYRYRERMKQANLFTASRAKPLATRRRSLYDEQNREAAEIILQDAERYGGDGALPVKWARTVMAREEVFCLTGRKTI